MHAFERLSQMSGVLLGAGLWLLGSCGEHGMAPPVPDPPSQLHSTSTPHIVLSGTRIPVVLTCELSSETAHLGDSWLGSVATKVLAPGGGVIPAGSPVEGVVAGVTRARPGSRAMLVLSLRSVRVGGRDESIAANASPVIAEWRSPREPGVAIASAAFDRGGDLHDRGVEAASEPRSVQLPLDAGSPRDPGPVVVLPEGLVVGFTVSQATRMR